MASTMKTNSYTYGLSEYCLTAVYLLYVYVQRILFQIKQEVLP